MLLAFNTLTPKTPFPWQYLGQQKGKQKKKTKKKINGHTLCDLLLFAGSKFWL